MIISNLEGGLGNQMFEYAAAFALARHHNVPLKIDNLFLLDTSPRYYRFECRPYCLDIFNISGELATKKEIKQFVTPRAGNKYWYHLRKRIFRSKNVFNEAQIPDYESLISLPSNAYLDGCFQKYRYFSAIKDNLMREFEFKYPLQQESLPILIQIKESNSVCIHIRKGDYVGHPILDVLSDKYYDKAIDLLCKQISNTVLFVFSDDIPWCQKNFHPQTDYPIIFIDSKHAEDRGRGHLQLMTNCKHFIIPNSSFSYWGAFLAKNENKIVIAPKVWYKGQVDTINPILPPDWLYI